MSTPVIRTGTDNGTVPSRKELKAPRGPDGRRRPKRIFTADYKLAILAEYDRCTESGDRKHVALHPIGGPSQTAVPDNEAANTWARQIRDSLSALASEPGIRSVDLFYSGTIELAVLIGWWLNAAGTIRTDSGHCNHRACVRHLPSRLATNWPRSHG